MDQIVTITALKKRAAQFVQERNWEQFHNLKNISSNIAIEAAELMEIFVWHTENKSQEILQEKREAIEHEISDIFFTLLLFCNYANIDLSDAMEHKLKIMAQRYPIDLAKGKNKKYNEL